MTVKCLHVGRPKVKMTHQCMFCSGVDTSMLCFTHPPAIVPTKPDGDELKHDGGKLRWSLLPWNALAKVVEVLMFGAKKYAARSWHKVANAEERYMDAAFRHMTDASEGEDYDKESGLLHLAHAGCCILFLIWFKIKSK